MPGSGHVIANMATWMAATLKACEAELTRHVAASENYAKAGGPWQDRTGAARGGIRHQPAFWQGTDIVAAVNHSTETGYYLENPNDNVYPYGNKSAEPFGSRYRILEEARDNNIEYTFARLRMLVGGRGFKGKGR